jgi:hypothetical protein
MRESLKRMFNFRTWGLFDTTAAVAGAAIGLSAAFVDIHETRAAQQAAAADRFEAAFAAMWLPPPPVANEEECALLVPQAPVSRYSYFKYDLYKEQITRNFKSSHKPEHRDFGEMTKKERSAIRRLAREELSLECRQELGW